MSAEDHNLSRAGRVRRRLLNIGISTAAALACVGSPGCDDGLSDASSTTGGPSSGIGGGSSTGASATDASSSTGRSPTLEVIRALTPPDLRVPDLPVFTYDAAGEVVELRKTDQGGEVHIDIPDGGGVAVLQLGVGTDNQGKLLVDRSIWTYEGVPDGATVAIYASATNPQPPPPPEHAPMPVVKVTVTGLPPQTYGWTAVLACAGQSTTGPSINYQNLLQYKGCRGVSTFDVAVYAQDANGSMIAFGHVEGLPFVEGSQAEVTVGVSAAPLVGQFSGSILNVPTGAYRADVEVGVSTPDSVGLFLRSTAIPPPPTLGLASPLPSNYGDEWFATGSVAYDSSGRAMLRRALTSPTFPQGPFVLDVSKYAKVDQVLETLADLSHISIEWTVQGADTADASLVSESWSRPSDTTRWSAVLPSGAGSTRLPDFPADYADWLPKPGDYLGGAYVGQVWDASTSFADYLDSVPDYNNYDYTISGLREK